MQALRNPRRHEGRITRTPYVTGPELRVALLCKMAFPTHCGISAKPVLLTRLRLTASVF